MTERHTGSDRREHERSTIGERPRVGRRSYLKLAGAAVGSSAFLATGADATRTTLTTPRFPDFSRTTDAVAAGCDPTGETPCDAAFRRMVGDDCLLSFPSGTYRFTRPHVVLGVEKLGLVGDGDVTFLVPPEFNANLLTIAGGSRFAFAGIDIDMTASGATPGLRLCARDRLLVENVTFLGQGTHPPTDGPVANALSPVVRSPDGVGIVRNVVARNSGSMGPAYRHPTGRAGIRVGSATRGTVTIADCHLDGFPVGGVYASETNGTIRVEGGRFRNNDVAGIRLGGAGSIENARVEVGIGDDTSIPGRMDACAIRFEGGGSGAQVNGCDVVLGPNAHGEGAVVAAHDYGGFTLRDSRIRVRAADCPAVRGLDPEEGYYSPPQGSLGTHFEGCSITGVGETPLVRLSGRPAPRFQQCSLGRFARSGGTPSGTDHDHLTDRDDEASSAESDSLDR